MSTTEEKSPIVAALLNLVVIGLGYLYIGGRWLSVGIVVVIADLALTAAFFFLFPLSAFTNPASTSLGTICGLLCGSGLFWLLVTIHCYLAARKHNDELAAAPPPPDPGSCGHCRGAHVYVPQYRKWFCPRCQKYAE